MHILSMLSIKAALLDVRKKPAQGQITALEGAVKMQKKSSGKKGALTLFNLCLILEATLRRILSDWASLIIFGG